MFGLFKKRQPEEPDRSTIVPRIKHLNFVSALAEMGIPEDQRPVTEPLVADLLVTYAFDLPESFQMVTRHDLERLSISPGELRSIALENLRRDLPGISVQEAGPLLQIVTGNNLEACSLLAEAFWTELAAQISGRTVVAVPSRDVVLVCSSESPDGLEVMREATTEVLENEHTHGLTDQFLTWQNGQWEIYE